MRALAKTTLDPLGMRGTRYLLVKVLEDLHEPAATIWLAETPSMKALEVDSLRGSCPLGDAFGMSHVIAFVRKRARLRAFSDFPDLGWRKRDSSLELLVSAK